MKSVWRAGRVWLALLAMSTLAACETGDPLSTTEPRSTGTFEEFEASVVAQAEATGIDLAALPSEVPLMRAGGWQRWVFVQGSAGDGAVEAVIGSRGGVLNLGAHWLLVPAGAVRDDVRFRMEPVNDGRYHVELTASDLGRDDNNVGRNGFRKPVYLAFNFGACPHDPDSLTVAWLTSNGSLVAQPTYIYDDEWAVGVLRHFSGYVLVAN